jgi:hypothetical protein
LPRAARQLRRRKPCRTGRAFARARDRSGQQKPAGFLLERIARSPARSAGDAPRSRPRDS